MEQSLSVAKCCKHHTETSNLPTQQSMSLTTIDSVTSRHVSRETKDKKSRVMMAKFTPILLAELFFIMLNI